MYEPTQGDPKDVWAMATWRADAWGHALISYHSNMLTLRELQGRVVLVNAADGTPVACGEIEPTTALAATLDDASASRAPAAAAGGGAAPAASSVGGLVVATPTTSGAALRGVAIGFTPASRLRWELHGAPLEHAAHASAIASGAVDASRAGAVHIAAAMPDVGVDGLRGLRLSLRLAGRSPANMSIVSGVLSGALSEAATAHSDVCERARARRRRKVATAAWVVGGIAALALVALLAMLNPPSCRSTARGVQWGAGALREMTARSPGSRSSLVEGSRRRGSLTGYDTGASQKERPRSPRRSLRANRWATSAERYRESIEHATPLLDLGGFSWMQPGRETSSNRRPRLLALHGAGANDEVVRLQLDNLGVDARSFEIYAPNAPLPVDPVGLQESLVQGPFYSWYEDSSSRDDVLRMLRRLIHYIQAKGPFDVMFGFSQGAAVLTACMQADVLSELSQERRTSEDAEAVRQTGSAKNLLARALGTGTHAMPVSRPVGPRRTQSMTQGLASKVAAERVIVECGAAPRPALGRQQTVGSFASSLSRSGSLQLKSLQALPKGTSFKVGGWGGKGLTPLASVVSPRACILGHAVLADALRAKLGLSRIGPSIAQPSVHIIGNMDPYKTQSESAVAAFATGSAQRLVLYHEAAHTLPRELQLNVLLHSRLVAHINHYVEHVREQQGEQAAVIEEEVADEEAGAARPSSIHLLEATQLHERDVGSPLPLKAAKSYQIGTLSGRSLLTLCADSAPPASTCEDVMPAEPAMAHVTLARHEWHSAAGARAAHPKRAVLLAHGGMSHVVRPIRSRCASVPVSRYASIAPDRDQQVVWCEVSDAVRQHPLTLREVLEAQPPGAPCVRAADESMPALTYGELLAFISPGGEGDLYKLGVRQGDVVAYACPGGSAAAVAFVSGITQCIAAPLDPSITETDASLALEQLGVRHVVIFEGLDAAGLRAAAAARSDVVVHAAVLRGPNGPCGLYTLVRGDPVEGGPAASPDHPSDGKLATSSQDVVLLLRTSGTTSRPKCVPLRQDALVRNALLLGASIELAPSDVCLNAMPLFHIGGLSAALLASWTVGSAVTCLPAFSPLTFCDALGASPRPTWYSAVPTIHQAIVTHVHDSGCTLNHSLRFVRSGAAAITPDDARALSAVYGGVPVVATYSMSEQMPITQPPAGLDQLATRRHGTVGVPVAASLAIVDAQSRAPQPPGQPGVIAISGPTVMRGYLNNPEANAQAFFLLSCANSGATQGSDERFFLTGDIGEVDADGHLTIKGRLRELIKRGGEQISPYEVEEAVAALPWIQMAVAFSVASPVWGEEVAVAIELASEAPQDVQRSSGALLRGVREACAAAKLAAVKYPSVAVAVTAGQIPMTSTRKPIRAGLADALGVVAPSAVHASRALNGQRLGGPKVSRALEGVRYFLACQVVFNHVGYQDTNATGTWGAVAQGRFFCIHVPSFFALGGFSLAMNMGPAPRSKLSYVAARLSSMYPMYLLSLLPLLINLLIMCPPSALDSNFHFLAQTSDALRGDFCGTACARRRRRRRPPAHRRCRGHLARRSTCPSCNSQGCHSDHSDPHTRTHPPPAVAARCAQSPRPSSLAGGAPYLPPS